MTIADCGNVAAPTAENPKPPTHRQPSPQRLSSTACQTRACRQPWRRSTAQTASASDPTAPSWASFNRVLRAAIALSSVQRLLTLCGSSPSCGRVTAVGVARARRARICLTRLSTRTWASCETCPAVRARSVRLSLRAMTAPPLPALDRVAANGGRCQRRSASLLDALSDRAVDAAPRSCARRAEARARRRCPALTGRSVRPRSHRGARAPRRWPSPAGSLALLAELGHGVVRDTGGASDPAITAASPHAPPARDQLSRPRPWPVHRGAVPLLA